jgi:hypothetical protein
MNTILVTTLQELLKTGAKLIPDGGSEFSGYNAKRQSTYLLWRKNCLDAIGMLREHGTVLFARIANDENGLYFYQSSAQTIANTVGEALEIAKSIPEPIVHLVTNVSRKAQPVTKIEPAPDVAIVEPVTVATPDTALDLVEPVTVATPIIDTEEKIPAGNGSGASDSDAEPDGLSVPDPELIPIEDETAAAITPIVLFSSSTHPVLKQVQKFFLDLSIECIVLTHAEGIWDALETLHDVRPLPRYAVFLLSEEYRAEELMALGYLAGKYPWLTLSCIHHRTITLPALLPGISSNEFVHDLDEIKFNVMKELKTAGYSVTL